MLSKGYNTRGWTDDLCSSRVSNLDHDITSITFSLLSANAPSQDIAAPRRTSSSIEIANPSFSEPLLFHYKAARESAVLRKLQSAMCKFTYLGYAGCEEPERHYLIRREKCSAKAHLKHWCGPNEQDESTPADDESRLNLECPMCADVPVVYDQPLLEIAHSRRSVLPAPHYDAVTGKYSLLGRHHLQSSAHHKVQTKHAMPAEPSASLVPKPLNPMRMQYDRSASENAVDRIKEREVSPDYKLPAATYMPSRDGQMDLPATSYMPPVQNAKLPMPLPIPQPAELTPPSSREASLSPPQSRMGHALRTIPPGESNRRELESIRERQRAAILLPKTSRPATPQSRPGTDRSRSGSESSTSSSSQNVPPPPPPPRMPSRKPSTASSTTSAASSSTPSGPQHYRKNSTSTSASASSSSSSSTSRSSPESGADRFATAALRTIGLDRTASPERGRRAHRRDRGGSSSERSDSPSVWRPTISPPQLQQDSLGMGPKNAEIAQSFKQRLVPFAPSRSGTSPSGLSSASARGEARLPPLPVEEMTRARTPQPLRDNGNGDNDGGAVKQATTLRLYPNKSDDEKIAQAAFNTMFHEEQKALYAAQAQAQAQMQSPPRGKKTVNFAVQQQQQGHPDEETLTEVDMQTVTQIARSGGDPYNVAGVGRRAAAAAPAVDNNNNNNKALPAGLRRIKTGQVKTVTVAPPRPPKRSNTTDSAALLAGPSTGAAAAVVTRVPVKGGPLFRFAGVGGSGGGSKALEFEIVSGSSEGNALGRVF